MEELAFRTERVELSFLEFLFFQRLLNQLLEQRHLEELYLVSKQVDVQSAFACKQLVSISHFSGILEAKEQ